RRHESRRRLGVARALADTRVRREGIDRRRQRAVGTRRAAEPVHQDPRHEGRPTGDRGVDLRRHPDKRDAAVLARALPGRRGRVHPRHRAARGGRPEPVRAVCRIGLREPVGRGRSWEGAEHARRTPRHRDRQADVSRLPRAARLGPLASPPQLRGTIAASPVGQHGHEGPQAVRRAVRDGARSPAHDQHHAREDAARRRRPWRRGCDAPAGRRRRRSRARGIRARGRRRRRACRDPPARRRQRLRQVLERPACQPRQQECITQAGRVSTMAEPAQGGRSMSTFDRRLVPAEDWIDPKEWTPPKHGIAPEIRLFGRWWNVLWLGLFAGVFLVISLVGSTWFIETETGKAFVLRYPGTLWQGPAMEAQGFPWGLRWQHYFNLFVMVLIIRSGLSILADHPRLYWNVHCTPGTEWFRFNMPVPTKMPYYTAKDDSVTISRWLGLPGIRHSVGIARWWHFSCALFWILNGVAFVFLLFATDQWQRLVPRTWEIIPNAASIAVQYASLHMPHENGWVRYNALQQLAYFTAVFIVPPLQVLTALAMAPAVGNRLRRFSILLNRQRARSIHFFGLLFFLGFILVHVTMVFVTGFRRNFNHIVMGTDEGNWIGFVWGLVGIGVIALVWIAATWISTHRPRLVQRAGRLIVGRVTLLMEWFSPNSEYKEEEISPFFWPNGTLPKRELWDRLLQKGPQGCTLKVFGKVAHPQEFTVDQLRGI